MTLVAQNHALDGVHIDHAAILRTLKLDPTRPETQALLLVCDRYGLDPLLKHAVLIQGSLYVTRDGYLAVAHRSGMFDGIEVVDTGVDQTHYWAKVAVYRKDMTHPFTYVGRYPKTGSQKAYAPEMAIKCAEVMALRRAFNVTGLPAADERWDVNVDAETGEIIETRPAVAAVPAAVEVREVTPSAPPAAPALTPGGFVPFPEEPPHVPGLNGEQMDMLNAQINTLDDAAKRALATKWKRELPAKSSVQFTVEHMFRALELIEETRDDMAGAPFDIPVDAE